MNLRSWLPLFSMVLVSPAVFCQTSDSVIKTPDTRISPDISAPQTHIIAAEAYNGDARISAPGYFSLLADDFKQGLTKPFHMKGKDWRNLGLFTVAAATLSLADEPVQQLAIRLRSRSSTLRTVSSNVTNFGGRWEAYMLVGMGAYGFTFKNIRLQTATLLATQAYITSSVFSDILKRTFGRQRPIYSDPTTHEAEPKFYGPFYKPRDANGNKIDVLSFPSGHTIAAFSVATVFAMEYKDKPWVPVLAYSAASLVGLSRITENKHWISDVFAGAAIGYLSGRLAVNNYHRYVNLKATARKKGFLSFNLQYNHGVIAPGAIYHFR